MKTCPRCKAKFVTPYYEYPSVDGLCSLCVEATRVPPAEMFPADPDTHNGAGCYDADTDFSQ